MSSSPPPGRLRAAVPIPNLSKRIGHACDAVLADNGASWFNLAVATAPKAMFIFLPIIAFLHMLLYWRPRHRYEEHLLFFLHLHAMVFSVAIVLFLLFALGDDWPALQGPLNIVYSIVFALTMAGVFVYAAMEL